jgi:hypothetical protein
MKPEYLYKYRECSENTFNIIKNSKLYFAHPCEFNDPFDSRIVANMNGKADKGLEEIYRIIESDSNYAYLSKEDKIKLAKNVVSALENPEFNKNAGMEFAEKVASSISVCCFSSKRDALTMWSHYADSHKGICFQFMNGKDIFQRAFPVNYTKEYPKLNFFSSLLIDRIDGFLLTKSEEWKYEEEYRIVLAQSKGTKPFQDDILTGIIFGCKINDAQKKYIIQLIKSRKHPINLYQAKMKEFEFGLDIQPI